MLDMFQKLINEHGSSVILKERIELINDKYEALETKLENAIKENEILKKENELQKQQIEQLSSQIQSNVNPTVELPSEQQAILKLLFEANTRVREEAIAHQLSLEVGNLSYHLDELHNLEYLNHPSYISGSPLTGTKGYREQSISKDGRKYVVEYLNA